MARRYFRRRRKPVEWVRTACATRAVGLHKPTDNGDFAILRYDGSNGQEVAVSNIIIGDDPFATTSLIEERKVYVLDRLVGRHHISLTGENRGAPIATFALPGPVELRVGVFVGEVDKTGSIQDLDRWDLFDYNSNEVDWMYRESMILGNNMSNVDSTGWPTSYTPQNMAGYMFDSTNATRAPWGMYDIKVKRKVGQMERLFWMYAMAGIDTQLDYSQNPANVTVWNDCRALLHWSASGLNRR